MLNSKTLRDTLIAGLLILALLPRQEVHASGVSFPPTALTATVVSAPATSSQATASVGSSATNRHVADCITFSSFSIVAPAATAVNVVLRDGATGAGTIIWQYGMILTATTVTNYPSLSFCGINRVGSVNTAMTLEFSAAVTNVTQVVTLTYHDVAP